jgi:hypothetical protein
MHLFRGVVLTGLLCLVVAAGPPGAWAAPEGQMTWAVHTTLVPAWFEDVKLKAK